MAHLGRAATATPPFVVMDAGIVTQAHLDWLTAQG